MIVIPVSSWTEFRDTVISLKTLNPQYIESTDRYEIYAAEDNSYIWNITIIKDGGADVIDWETNYKSLANNKLSPEKDQNGVPFSRTKITTSGWHYQLYGIEFKTAELNSLIDKDINGNLTTNSVIKFYDSNNIELTTQQDIDSSCVKTVVDFEPEWDYEIIGGSFRQLVIPSSSVRMYCIGVPDISTESGGSVPFANNINLKYVGISDSIRTDGRASKRLTYDPVYHTNKIRVIIEHDVLIKHNIHIMFELYRG